MIERLLKTSQKLNASMEALAALGAKLRVDSEGLTMHPTIGALVDSVVGELGFSLAEIAALPDEKRLAVAGLIRSFFLQAAELLEQPERGPGWSGVNTVVVQAQGRASMAIVPIIQAIAPQLGDLSQRLATPGAKFLDVGTGAGWLAVAMTQAFGNLHVVGIDVLDEVLELARANTKSLSQRIEIRRQDVAELDEPGEYDAVFLPGPFLPKQVVWDAVRRVSDALRPGGWLLFGVYAPIEDPLSAKLTDLRVARSGGYPWQQTEVVQLLESVGYEQPRAFERSWQMPMTFVVGRRPE